jgi:hypothetical protein
MAQAWLMFAIRALACGGLMASCVGCEHRDDTLEIIDNLKAAGYPAGAILVVDGVVYLERDAKVDLAGSLRLLGDARRPTDRSDNRSRGR